MWFGFRGMEYPALLGRLRPGWTVKAPLMCLNRKNTGENRRLLVFNGPGAGTTILRFVDRPVPESLVQELKQCFVERRHKDEEERKQLAEDVEGATESLPDREVDSQQGVSRKHRQAPKGKGKHQEQPLVAFLQKKVNKPRRKKR